MAIARDTLPSQTAERNIDIGNLILIEGSEIILKIVSMLIKLLQSTVSREQRHRRRHGRQPSSIKYQPLALKPLFLLLLFASISFFAMPVLGFLL